jgi:hypothetical protein
MTKQERLERLRQLRIEKAGAAFPNHHACLEWIDKVAPLLRYDDQRHYDSFQDNARFVRISELSTGRMMTHLNAMIAQSIVNQAIAELEIHSDSEPVPEQASKPTESGMATKETELDIFISHSGQDQQIASVLIDLLRTAMDIPPKRIRCTSVDGYRLPGGASTDDQLKREVRETKCFIALLTPRSIRSTYVLFELGARWGAKLPFIPLLAAGLNAPDLEGPVSGLNALSCASTSQLHQLITDIHGIIGGAKHEPSAYDAKLQALMSLSEQTAATLGNPQARADKDSPQLKKKELSDAAKEILEMILKEPEPDRRGIVLIHGEIQPGQICFFPSLQYAGSPLSRRSRYFKDALVELQEKGWLHPPEDNPSSKTTTFEFIPQIDE